MMNDKIKPWQKVLAFYEPTVWEITLHSGHKIMIYADGHSVKGDEDVFDVLLEGTPPTIEVVARIPSALIREYWTPYIGLTKPDDSSE